MNDGLDGLRSMLVLAPAPRPTRPRDSQRSKVYAAERAALGSGAPGNTRPDWDSLEDAAAFVDQIVASAWWKARSRDRRVIVVDGRGSRSARATHRRGLPVIALPRWARSRWVVCHELAHHLTPRSAPAHGPQFAANYLAMVRRWIGPDEATSLKESFRASRVKSRR